MNSLDSTMMSFLFAVPAAISTIPGFYLWQEEDVSRRVRKLATAWLAVTGGVTALFVINGLARGLILVVLG